MLPNFSDPGILMVWIIILTTVLFGLVVDGWTKRLSPERMASLGTIAVIALQTALIQPTGRDFDGRDFDAWAADIAMFLTYALLMVSANRKWPMSAAAFQLMAIGTHFVMVSTPNINAWAWAQINFGCSLAATLSHFGGCLNSALRRYRGEAIPDWAPWAQRRP